MANKNTTKENTPKENKTKEAAPKEVTTKKAITKEKIIEICKQCLDPELGIDIWTLGLVYDITITDDGVRILMTFTSPFCPFGPTMVEELKKSIEESGAKVADVQITFEPPWKPSDELREMMGV